MGDRYTLPAGIWNLRDVGEPLLIWGRSLEITVDEIVQGRADFSQVRAIPTPLRSCHDQAFLLHQTPHDFLRNEDVLPAQ